MAAPPTVAGICPGTHAGLSWWIYMSPCDVRRVIDHFAIPKKREVAILLLPMKPSDLPRNCSFLQLLISHFRSRRELVPVCRSYVPAL